MSLIDSLFPSENEYNIAIAEEILRDGDPLPLDLYAALVEAGVDIDELERNAR